MKVDDIVQRNQRYNNDIGIMDQQNEINGMTRGDCMRERKEDTLKIEMVTESRTHGNRSAFQRAFFFRGFHVIWLY